jgi:hypothetical protein
MMIVRLLIGAALWVLVILAAWSAAFRAMEQQSYVFTESSHPQ